MTKRDIDSMIEKQNFILSIGMTPLFNDNSGKLKVMCKNGHTFDRFYYDFKKGSISCPECVKKERENIVISRGYSIIDVKEGYIFTVKCNVCNDVFTKPLVSFKKNTVVCHNCEKIRKMKLIEEYGFTLVSDNLSKNI